MGKKKEKIKLNPLIGELGEAKIFFHSSGYKSISS